MIAPEEITCKGEIGQLKCAYIGPIDIPFHEWFTPKGRIKKKYKHLITVICNKN